MVGSLFSLYLYVLHMHSEYAKNLSWGQHETTHIVIFDKEYLFKTLMSPDFFAMHLLFSAGPLSFGISLGPLGKDRL